MRTFSGLFAAEWRKSLKNQMIAGFLVWIFPVGVGAFFITMLLLSLVSERIQELMLAGSSGLWTHDMLGIWPIMTSFPINIFPRLLPLAFMAVAFAGEYQWGMWKNLVPRSRRWQLITVKLLVTVLVVMVSLALTSLLLGAGQALLHAAAGQVYGPTLSAQVLGEFLVESTREALLGMAALLVLACYAAITALLTRSILGGLLAGFGLSVLEALSFTFLILLGQVLERPALVNLYQFAPSYQIDNIRSWLTHNAAYALGSGGFTAEPSLAFSLLALAGWILGLALAAVLIFERQDILT